MAFLKEIFIKENSDYLAFLFIQICLNTFIVKILDLLSLLFIFVLQRRNSLSEFRRPEKNLLILIAIKYSYISRL